MWKKIMLFTSVIFLIGCSISVNTGELEVLPIRESAVENSPKVITYDNFWDAMQNFDFEYVERNSVTENEEHLCFGLQYIFEGEYQKSEKLFSHIIDNDPDSLFLEKTANILQGMLTLDFDYLGLIDLDEKLPKNLDELGTIDLVKFYSQGEPEKIIFANNPVPVETELSISGVPMVEVEINGVKKKFWIDTGAELTVLASDFADKCGFEADENYTAEVGTSTDVKVSTWPVIIDEMKIGDVKIQNHRAFVIDKKNLTFKMLKIIKLLKIDGIIGWNAIQNMKLEIDYKNLQTTITKPVKMENKHRNFHFGMVPFISLKDENNTDFQFFLDTGASSTDFYTKAIAKLDTTGMEVSKAKIGGAGGFQNIKQYDMFDKTLILGKNQINFAKIAINPDLGDHDAGFFKFDGVLGSDIAKNGTLILDFQNGVCELVIDENND